jgi:hypothetical protein
MDAIKNIGTSVGGWFGKNPKVLPGVATGVGALSNFFGQRKSNQLLDAQLNAIKQEQDLFNDPTKLAAKVAGVERPLDAGLTSGVGNEVQAFLAEHGLGESPAIASEVMAQALAPYKQNNQNTAIQTIMRLMGAPLEAGVQRPQPTDLTGLLKMLMTPSGTNPTTGSASPPASGTGVPSTGADTPAIDFSNFGDFLNPDSAFANG